MKKLLKILSVSAILALAPAGSNIYAAKPNVSTDTTTERVKELDDMTNEELLTSVDVSKYSDLIKKFQFNEAKRLINGKYNPKSTACNVETMRNGEIVIITIPASKLFMPNETSLAPFAAQWLTPLKRYMKNEHPDMYRVLLVMHTDNTGSEEYSDKLSLERVDAVFDWFEHSGADTRYVFPSASGSSDPLPNTPNNSMENRARNRRLEIYLIPGKLMLDSAKKGRIAL